MTRRIYNAREWDRNYNCEGISMESARKRMKVAAVVCVTFIVLGGLLKMGILGVSELTDNASALLDIAALIAGVAAVSYRMKARNAAR